MAVPIRLVLPSPVCVDESVLLERDVQQLLRDCHLPYEVVANHLRGHRGIVAVLLHQCRRIHVHQSIRCLRELPQQRFQHIYPLASASWVAVNPNTNLHICWQPAKLQQEDTRALLGVLDQRISSHQTHLPRCRCISGGYKFSELVARAVSLGDKGGAHLLIVGGPTGGERVVKRHDEVLHGGVQIG